MRRRGRREPPDVSRRYGAGFARDLVDGSERPDLVTLVDLCRYAIRADFDLVTDRPLHRLLLDLRECPGFDAELRRLDKALEDVGSILTNPIGVCKCEHGITRHEDGTDCLDCECRDYRVAW